MNNTLDTLMNPPVQRIIETLEQAGVEAWLVGGCVRDGLMGQPIHDIDIASSASWQETVRLCQAAGMTTVETGTQHGTVTIIADGTPFEVTTFRGEGQYQDGRHPEYVFPVDSIDEDLARRDFTINAMAWNPSRGLRDPYGGQADAAANMIRAVGKAQQRFDEDALRILRGARFASQLGFTLETETAHAMNEAAHNLARISAERIAAEMDALLKGSFVHDALMNCAPVICAAIPELSCTCGFDQQSKYHSFDVYEHLAWSTQQAPQRSLVRWCAFLHDIGKPATMVVDEAGAGHFPDHAAVGEAMARNLLKRLRFPTRFIHDACLLIRYHDIPIAPTPRATKRMLQRLDGREDLFRDLCALKRADSLAHAPQWRGGTKAADDAEKCLDAIIEQNAAFSRSALAINGNDVIKLGVPAGPAVGRALDAALNAVIDETRRNECEPLLDLVRELMVKGI